MKALFIAFALVQLLLNPGSAANAQTTSAPAASAQSAADAGITPNGAIGEVKVIDAASHQMIIKTDAGSLVTVALDDATIYMHLAPG